LGIGDWGLGIGDWAQSPIPNPQSPIPNGSRFLAFYMSGKNPDWEKRFKALFSMIDFIILKFFKNFTPSPCERFKKNLQTFQECK
jgi:hypothetical protein